MPKERRIRKQVLVLRLNEDERALLEALSEDMALKLSDTMRQCIRAEAKRRNIPLIPKQSLKGTGRKR